MMTRTVFEMYFEYHCLNDIKKAKHRGKWIACGHLYWQLILILDSHPSMRSPDSSWEEYSKSWRGKEDDEDEAIDVGEDQVWV